MKTINKKAIDKLEDIRFWLAVLRRFEGFTNIQKEKLNGAYYMVNEVYENFERDDVLKEVI